MIRRYLLDTGIAQDFQDDRRGARAKEARLLGHRIGICIPVLGEHWSGVEGSLHREPNVVSLRRALSQLSIWPYTAEAAAEYGRIFMELRRAGRPMQQIDIQIGAIARTLPNCIIVSKDSDLSAIRDVTVENWAT
ncbi:MAG: type II toxin-antitoxin system VapC family toxin [Planctomycetales bacterium]|nr:type II toxin-antitoxin system VapC family toxin [Planctomycetales bacterium]